MLTLQALKYPEYKLAGPFGTMPQEPDNLWGFTLQGSAHDLPGSTYKEVLHIQGKVNLCKLKTARTGRASTNKRNTSLHKDELHMLTFNHVLTYLQLH